MRSQTLVEGSTVLGCRNCRQFCVEGSDRWVVANEGFRLLLRLMAAELKDAQETTKAIMESDISDPRWEQLA